MWDKEKFRVNPETSHIMKTLGKHEDSKHATFSGRYVPHQIEPIGVLFTLAKLE